MNIQLVTLIMIIMSIVECSKIAKIRKNRHNKQILHQITSNFNVTTLSGTRQAPCSCGHGLCSCCSRILFNLWQQRACINITYDPDEFAFTVKIITNDQLLYKRTISGKNPRPFCVPIPRISVVRACIRFYNVYFQGRNVHTCINIEGKFQDTTLFKLGMNCVRFGSNGVSFVKPEDGGGIGQIEFLPENMEDNADFVEDYEYYDGEEDDEFFDY